MVSESNGYGNRSRAQAGRAIPRALVPFACARERLGEVGGVVGWRGVGAHDGNGGFDDVQKKDDEQKYQGQDTIDDDDQCAEQKLYATSCQKCSE